MAPSCVYRLYFVAADWLQRRDLGLLQVSSASTSFLRTRLTNGLTELWRVLLDHQCHHRSQLALCLWPRKLHPCPLYVLLADIRQNTGGPAVMVWGWVVVGGFALPYIYSDSSILLHSMLHHVCRACHGGYVRYLHVLYLSSLFSGQKSAAHIQQAAAPTSGLLCFANLSRPPLHHG